MMREMLLSKIHRATVTGADIDYEGSIAIDTELMKAADIKEGQSVWIWDITNGNRVMTYVIPGTKGEIAVNGAAAKVIDKGDMVIIACFVYLDDEEVEKHQPKLVFVDENNSIKELGSD